MMVSAEKENSMRMRNLPPAFSYDPEAFVICHGDGTIHRDGCLAAWGGGSTLFEGRDPNIDRWVGHTIKNVWGQTITYRKHEECFTPGWKPEESF